MWYVNISGIVWINFVLLFYCDDLFRGINVNVFIVDILVSVDVVFFLVGVIINVIVSYVELIIVILYFWVGVYLGVDMFIFKVVVGIVVIIDGNFNIVRFLNFIVGFGIVWYSKRLNYFWFFYWIIGWIKVVV